MSTESGVGESSSTGAKNIGKTGQSRKESEQQHTAESTPQTPPKLKEEGEASQRTTQDEKSAQQQVRPPAAQLGASLATDTQDSSDDPPRQVIAVSASKGPAAFFNLARKFLATDEMCDLSALEGAIVSAVDAAHLLERSQLATIIRVHTSYVTVEPKRRKQVAQTGDREEGTGASSQQAASPGDATVAQQKSSDTSTSKETTKPQTEMLVHPVETPATTGGQSSRQGGSRGSSGRELRRARIVITVKRTDSYKQWLRENPLQAIIGGDTETLETGMEPSKQAREQKT